MNQDKSKILGITTTVPVEVIIAAGYRPMDLINLFVGSEDHMELIDLAERDGFPKSLCACIKGIYGACIKYDIKKIIGVIEGDCSNSKALLEVLQDKGVDVVDFRFPHSRGIDDMKSSMDSLMKDLGVTMDQVENVRKRLMTTRALVREIDEETYIHNRASGFENHLFQVMNSDMGGESIDGFEEMLKDKLAEIRLRNPDEKSIRLGFIGVPPVITDLYEFLERNDARVVYNEVQREFAFPRTNEDEDIYCQYLNYTYPYDIYFRLEKIKEEIKNRKLDAIIHYTQAFCYRGIEDIIIKKELDIPVLTIEGDKSTKTDSRTKLRFEAFLDMLIDVKKVKI